MGAFPEALASLAEFSLVSLSALAVLTDTEQGALGTPLGAVPPEEKEEEVKGPEKEEDDGRVFPDRPPDPADGRLFTIMTVLGVTS